MPKGIFVYTVFLFVFILINVIIYFLIQLKGKQKLFTHLFLYWLSVLFVLLLEGLVTDGKLGLSLIFLVNFLPIAIISNFLLSLSDHKFKLQFYFWAIPSAVLLTFIFHYLNSPFQLMSLPIVLVTAGPLIEGLYVYLILCHKDNWQIEKIIACLIFSVGIFSCFYYAAYRFNATELQYLIGFGSAFLSYLMCSMLLPILCIEVINRKKTEYLEEVVNERTRELYDSKCEKEKLLRVLVHDISNPLQAVIYNASLMKKSLPVENELLKKIQKNLAGIKEVITHVREYESVMSGKKNLELEEILLTECLEEVEEMFTDRFKLKGINLIIQNKLPKDARIKVDRTSFIHSVASNLVSNALKFSRPGSDVLVVAYQKMSNIVIEVVDHGIGMPEEILNNLFDLKEPTTREGTLGESGNGFGMPIVKSYTNIFGGHVEAFSSQQLESHGTRIALYLPNFKIKNQVSEN